MNKFIQNSIITGKNKPTESRVLSENKLNAIGVKLDIPLEYPLYALHRRL
jgi:hypothetical protein